MGTGTANIRWWMILEIFLRDKTQSNQSNTINNKTIFIPTPESLTSFPQ